MLPYDIIKLMACCLIAPIHHLNQCWLLISEVLWHSSENNFTVNAQTSILYIEFENCTFKIIAKSYRGQWVNTLAQLIDIWAFSVKLSSYQVNSTRPHWWLANSGSGNGLVPSGNKPCLNQCCQDFQHHMASLGHNELMHNGVINTPGSEALVQMMAWHQSGHKALSESVMA